MKSNWLSRKLITTIAGGVVIVASAMTGEQSWSQAGWQLVALIGAYLGVQGAQNIAVIARKPE